MGIIRYAGLDTEGRPTAFYSTDVHKVDQIPTGVVEISEGIWQKCLSGDEHSHANGAWNPCAQRVVALTEAELARNAVVNNLKTVKANLPNMTNVAELRESVDTLFAFVLELTVEQR